MGRFYITTPIYYVNAAPHLGHAYSTIVADSMARWQRLLGNDVTFLTGTDEHGLKIQQAADGAGTSPQEFVDGIADTFSAAWQKLDISNSDFIRTTEPRHFRAVERLLQACYEAGDIELDTYEGLYCVACEAYYTESELDGGNCRIHRRPVQAMKEENYFFRLSRFEDRLLDWYARHPDAIKPRHRANEVTGFIRQGLQDFSISRTSLTWGIPLPWDSGHVTYVWFDALTNYLSAIGYGEGGDSYTDWWPVDYHVIGKDIVRFHNVYWPAMLMSAGVEPPKGWAVGGWLLVGGEKMSKTQGNVVNPLDLVDEFGVDGFRYYILADTPYGTDGDFTVEGLTAKYNGDLANNLGNLLSRVATVVAKKCDGVGQAPNPDSPLATVAAESVADTIAAWEEFAPHDALRHTWNLARATNAHLERHEPWKAEPGPEVDQVMGDALEALRIVAILASPAIPNTSQAIWERLGLAGRADAQRVPDDVRWGGYPGGLTVTKGDALFPATLSIRHATVR